MINDSERDFNLNDLIDRFESTQYIDEYLRMDDEYMEKFSLAVLKKNYEEANDEKERMELFKKQFRHFPTVFNRLLDFYSLLEIAAVIGFVPDHFPEEFKNEVDYYLSHDQAVEVVRQYPCVLLLFFQNRLSGVPHEERPKDYPGEVVLPFFYSFLNLNSVVEEDKDVRRFISSLTTEDGRFFDKDLFLKMLRSHEVLKYILGTDDFLDADAEKWGLSNELVAGTYQLLILGYFKWLKFLYDLDELLTACDRFPEIENLFLQYHARWFVEYPFQDILEETTKLATELTKQFETGEQSPFTDLELTMTLELGSSSTDLDIEEPELPTPHPHPLQELAKFEALIARMHHRLNINEGVYA